MPTKSAPSGSKRKKRSRPKAGIAALDLGGTYIKAALVSPKGKVVHRSRRATEAEGGPRHVISRLVATVRELCSEAGVDSKRLIGVGVGCAGPLSPQEGVVYHSPNLPGWSRVHLRAMMEDDLRRPVIIENDANAWALGEFIFGAGRGARNLVCLTLGTGVGGGIIVDGRLVHGSRGLAAELGHMTINTRGPLCSCGSRGCLEVYASASAVRRSMRRRLKAGAPSKVRELVEKSPSGLSSKVVSQAARLGDGPAQEALAEVGCYLGVGIANIANIFNPEMVVLGGAVAGAGRFLIGPAREEAKRRAFPGVMKDLRIVRAKLGEDAGLLGAASPFLKDLR